MKKLIQLEEMGMLLLSTALFSITEYDWWWFPALILTPDISLLGYMINHKVGAVIYNLFHHKGVAILVYLIGFHFMYPLMQVIGVILFAHSSMDRLFGFGLKYIRSFHDTHLGRIGKKAEVSQPLN